MNFAEVLTFCGASKTPLYIFIYQSLNSPNIGLRNHGIYIRYKFFALSPKSGQYFKFEEIVS